MNRKRQRYIAAIFALSIITVGGWWGLGKQNPVNETSDAVHAFTVDIPVERARKILVRTNAAERIIAMADAKLLDQRWQGLNVDFSKPIRDKDWEVQSERQIDVQFHDAYLGQHDITLEQNVDITAQKLIANNQLKAPTGPLEKYIAKLTLSPDQKGNARFELELSLAVKTTAALLTRKYVISGIKQSAANALAQQEQAIRSIINEHADQLFILPKHQTAKR